jgi:hypothetical protein
LINTYAYLSHGNPSNFGLAWGSLGYANPSKDLQQIVGETDNAAPVNMQATLRKRII